MKRLCVALSCAALLGTAVFASRAATLNAPGPNDSGLSADADTGEYVWHYQTTPSESWDYNSAMDMTLATLQINGKARKVILHAPKNGFFYVVDRETGKLISAEKFTKVTWAERIDPSTGRPVEAPIAHYDKGGLFDELSDEQLQMLRHFIRARAALAHPPDPVH